MSRIGGDWYSDRMLDAMRAEGIGVEHIEQPRTRNPDLSSGLYLVRTDASGEPSFTYFRRDSPATLLFRTAKFDHIAASYDVVYLSAVTLQVLRGWEPRNRLWELSREARANGARVVFDSNYRSQGWDDDADARRAIDQTLALTDIALPTFADEQKLYGDHAATACASRIAALGVPEVVVKDGANGCVVYCDGTVTSVPALPVASVVDTTAAGDSFNGGYLAARLTGASAVDAAAAGNALASLVIGHPGAIVPESVLARR